MGNRNKGPLRLLNIILSTVGITPLFCKKGEHDAWLQLWHTINVIYILIVMGCEFTYLMCHTEEIFTTTEHLHYFVASITVLVKTGCYIVHRHEMKDIVDMFIYEDYTLSMPIVSYVLNNKIDGPRLNELKSYISESWDKLMKVIDIFLKFYVILSYVPVGQCLFMPIIVQTIYPDEHYRELPIGMWYPWDPKKTVGYFISYCLTISVGFVEITVFVGVDVLLALLVGHLLRQLKIVGLVARNVDEMAAELTEQRGSEEWQTESTRVLSNCAEHYTKLKTYSGRLNVIHQPLFFTQALSCSIMICLSFYNIAIKDKLALSTTLYYAYATINTTQIFFYCWVGQQLVEQSEQLEKEVYCEWWLHNRRHQTVYLTFLGSIQRGITVRLYGSTNLSYAIFAAIAKSTLSYLTMIKSFVEVRVQE